MSDLQISLLGIGACVVAGVYAFNSWQERQFRRLSEAAFEREHDDVLMPAAPAADDVAEARIEPTLDAPPAASVFKAPVPRARTSSAQGVDFSVWSADWHKPVLVAGYDAATGVWLPAGMDSGSEHAQLRFALQMSNRSGCIEREQLSAFRDAVQKWAESRGGKIKCLDIDLAHAMAVQLDRFCADVDIAIGVNVVTRDSAPISGTKIRALAEAGGLKLESDGVFYLRGDSGNTLYTLDNHEPMPFMPEQIKTLSTGGVTFLLDVPRVADALREFEGMLACARSFGSKLGGTLVDDNRNALTEEAIDKIRRQLTGILATMEAGQIAAGGERALRLFS